MHFLERILIFTLQQKSEQRYRLFFLLSPVHCLPAGRKKISAYESINQTETHNLISIP